MKKKRVAVISEDPFFCEFFRLEALACGCEVSVTEAPPATMTELERAVLDVRAGACVADHSACLVAAVLTDGRKAPSFPTDRVWEWPISVETVREFLEEAGKDGGEREPTCGEPVLYVLSEKERRLLYRNRTVELTPHAWRVLTCLGERAGQTVPRNTLEELLGEEKGNMTEVYIHHLRKKLEEPYGVRLIRTVRGVGYRLDAKWVAFVGADESNSCTENR